MTKFKNIWLECKTNRANRIKMSKVNPSLRLNGMIKNYCSIYMMCINQYIIHTYKLIHFQIETIAYEIHMINKYPSWSHGITQWTEIRFFYHLQRRKRSNITLTLFWIADISVILWEELFESGAPITPVLPHSKFSTMTSS